MGSKTTKDWMERLVQNYKIPTDNLTEKKEPKRMLKESQIKIIMQKQ